MPTTVALAEKLQRLRAADGQFQLPGSRVHRYKSVRVTAARLDAFEAALGVKLPDEYHEFLEFVGYRAGPFDGLWTPEEVIRNSWSRAPALPFPYRLDTMDGARAEWRLKAGDQTFHHLRKDPPFGYDAPGCVLIGVQPKRASTALVTTGELTGSVWEVSERWNAWRPAWEVGRTWSFDSWYSSWLDRSLAELARKS
ncbi:SMI1/KNR4 family protein [Amycolatopsis sp. H20-H5]|uniref:SMI1/KNR4 family protein n=1 Tax=Amycolatopsis sp. H20-H5 TaxID=3046309 RepID=UPI002DB95097|nr:SMI1/KNR4 family protein [Amycolatopsis sp. H20-H5]MEC3975387.1 SMI1/KNR4 family protein [Amycolatopsis sp. H20-H5]